MKVIYSCDNLFTGTGWSSDVEHNARVLAAEKGVFSIAALDHWVNYLDRFTRLNNIQLPDQIIVFDKIAYRKASVNFPQTEVLLLKSFYKDYILKKITKIKPAVGHVLYICEPLRKFSESSISFEEELLLSFLTKVQYKHRESFSRITIRLHPSENTNTYNHIIKQFKNLNISIDVGELAHAIGRATTIVGCSSYALYLAYHSGR